MLTSQSPHRYIRILLLQKFNYIQKAKELKNRLNCCESTLKSRERQRKLINEARTDRTKRLCERGEGEKEEEEGRNMIFTSLPMHEVDILIIY